MPVILGHFKLTRPEQVAASQLGAVAGPARPRAPQSRTPGLAPGPRLWGLEWSSAYPLVD